MKFFTFVSLATAAVAQTIWIQAPGNNQEIVAGDDFVVEVQSQDTATPYTDIAAAIGIQPWSSGHRGDDVGQFLVYQGNWSIDGFAYPQGGLYTNVTVTAPSELPAGPALLSVVMFQTYSPENTPILQTAGSNITIVSSS